MTDLSSVSSVSSAAPFTTPALVSSLLSHLFRLKPHRYRPYLLYFIFGINLSQVLLIAIITFPCSLPVILTAGLRGELVERTLMASLSCHLASTAPSNEPLATLRSEHCWAFLANGVLFSPRLLAVGSLFSTPSCSPSHQFCSLLLPAAGSL